MSLARRARLLTPALVLSLVPAYGFVGIDTPLSQEATSSSAATPKDASENIRHVAQLEYALGDNGGTDIEFATIAVDDDGVAETAPVERTFAFAGTYQNGLQIVDVTDPTNPEEVAIYECGISQGDVQVFERDGRTLVAYTMDSGYSFNAETQCYLEATALGDHTGETSFGTFIADVTDPSAPTTVAFVPVAQGSHNQTVHPSGNYLYNSNSDTVIDSLEGAIEVFDISDLRSPELVAELPLPPRPGLGVESHDITFNTDGTRAYSAALSQTVIINTEDPAKPSIVSTFVDPAINVEHQANPITIDDPLYGTAEFLIVEDEFAGAAGAEQTCPSGGVHVYDITGELEQSPRKVGYWNIDDVTSTQATGLKRCTAHVFQLHEEEALMTIAFYGMGVSVVDLSSLVGVSLGANGVGMHEVAYAHFADSDTWAVKAPSVTRDGTFHIFGNDQKRGMDIYEVELALDPVTDPAALSVGTGRDSWLTPLEADRLLLGRTLPDDYTPFCLLGDRAS